MIKDLEAAQALLCKQMKAIEGFGRKKLMINPIPWGNNPHNSLKK